MNALADPDTFLSCDGRKNGQHRIFEDAAGIKILLGEAPVADPIGGEAVRSWDHLSREDQNCGSRMDRGISIRSRVAAGQRTHGGAY